MKKKEKNGCIYLLTNPSFPEYVKIGYAHDIQQRLKQLNRSETIPYAFRVYATYRVSSQLTDKELHKLIDTLNPSLRTIENFDGKKRVKEFYAMSAEDAFALLVSIAKISGTENRVQRMTPEGHAIKDEKLAEENRELARRGPFKFVDCGIAPGEKIKFIDDPKIQPIVVDDRHIEYQGETTSLSALACKLKKIKHAIQGPLYFTYKGEVLADRRDRFDAQKEKRKRNPVNPGNPCDKRFL